MAPGPTQGGERALPSNSSHREQERDKPSADPLGKTSQIPWAQTVPAFFFRLKS